MDERRRGPECPTCKQKSYLVEYGRSIVYWYCKKCKKEVPHGWTDKPVHSLEKCDKCGGEVAHDYWCPIEQELRKKKRRR